MYEIESLERETPWHGLYRAQKVFYNFRYDDRQVYEAARDEWIDVLVRVCAYPEGVLPADVEKRRGLLRYEATDVLCGNLPWFPQAIDWIEIPLPKGGEADFPAGLAGARQEPALVLSRFHGQTVRGWREKLPAASPECLHLCAEAAELLTTLHRRRQCVGGWGPDDFQIDAAGRLFFSATDRIVSSEAPEWLRRFYPASRYPVGFAAPEIADAEGRIDRDTDLYTWAALSFFLVTGSELAEFVGEETGASGLTAAGRDALQTALAALEPTEGEPLLEPPWSAADRSRAMAPTLVDRWAACVAGCLQPDREARREWIEPRSNRPARRSSFWKRVLGRG